MPAQTVFAWLALLTVVGFFFGRFAALVVGVPAFLIILLAAGRALRRTSTLAPMGIAIATVVLLHRLHTEHLPPGWQPEIRAQIFDQGVIPYLILGFTALGIISLLQIYAVYDQSHWNGQFTRIRVRLIALYFRDGDIAAVQRLRDDILDDHEREIHLAFTSVRHTEWVLPLFGFLGTVIGLGMALGHMQSAVTFGKEGVVITPDQLNLTFGGMAMSFYTTLMGLLGMLVLAFGHVAVRSRIEGTIAGFSNRLTKEIEGLENQPSTVRVVESPGDDQISHATNVLMKCLREDPALYARFGPILFERFVVSAAKYVPLTERVKQAIGGQLGATWQIHEVTGTTAGANGCAMLIGVRAETTLCTFEVAADAPARSKIAVHKLSANFDKLIAFDHETMLIRSVSNTNLHWWTKGTLDDTGLTARDPDLLLPVPRGPGSPGVIRVAGDPNNRQITHVTKQGHSAVVQQHAGRVNWTAGAVSPDGRFLALAGRSLKDRGSRVTVIELRHQGSTAPGTAPGTAPAPVICDVAVSFDKVQQALWLTPDELLLVADDGTISLFDTASRQSPAPLEHPDWRRTPQPWIVVGVDRWFAVLQNKHLSMWRVTAGGGLVQSPKSERVMADDIVAPRVAAIGAQGSQARLVGGTGQTMTVWEYPSDGMRRSNDGAAAASAAAGVADEA